jgi:hypothetical protein
MNREARHVYVQRVEGERLVEHDLRAEDEVRTTGQVVRAAYLEERGIFARVAGFLRGEELGTTLTLAPPFDAQGEDALGLFAEAETAGVLEPHGAQKGEVRRARGKIVALGPEVPPDGVVLRALWLERAPALHACEAYDFAVVAADAPTLVLSFGLAPLVVARPEASTAGAFLEAVGPRARDFLATLGVSERERAGEEGQLVTLTVGQTVEVLCVVREEVRDARELVLGGIRRTLPPEAWPVVGPYRDSAAIRAVIAGDAPGTRAVLRAMR